jgi:hypothetical protein
MDQHNPGRQLDGLIGSGAEASDPGGEDRKHVNKRPWRGPVGPTGTQEEHRHSEDDKAPKDQTTTVDFTL